MMFLRRTSLSALDLLLMHILALDPAEYRVGWARGSSGVTPLVGVYKLRKEAERTEDACERFALWLHGQLIEHGIELLVVEHFLPQGAKVRVTDKSREGQVGLGYTARAVAAVMKVHFRSPYVQTVRVHFCGQASAGDRDSTKAMVIKQAQLLGYIPKDCRDDNMADASALFDFASSHWGRKATAFRLV